MKLHLEELLHCLKLEAIPASELQAGDIIFLDFLDLDFLYVEEGFETRNGFILIECSDPNDDEKVYQDLHVTDTVYRFPKSSLCTLEEIWEKT